jgi:hypothetical protein
MQRKHSRKEQSKGQVKIEFSPKLITSWGGTAAIMSSFLNKIGFKEIVRTCFPMQETSNNSTGVYAKIISLFISILNGGFRFSHINFMDSSTKIFERCFEVRRLPKSSTGLTRYWNKYNRQSHSEQLHSNISQHFLPVVLKAGGIVRDTLRFDSTVITRYGEQEGAKRGYNPAKRGRPSHQPQIAFLGSGYTVNFFNRSGNVKSSNGIVEFYKRTMTLLGGVEIERVLADSGYYAKEFINTLEGQGVEYVISAPIYQVWQRHIYALKNWITVARGIEVCEFQYAHISGGWGGERRYVVVRQEIAEREKATGKQLNLFKELDYGQRYRHSLMVTNNLKVGAYEIWNYYKPRANDENVIDNLKDGFGLSAYNMKNFWATEAVLMTICLIFHNLITYLVKMVLLSEQRSQRLRTIRMEYLVIPALLGKDGRDDVLRIGLSSPKRRTKFLEVLEKLKHIVLNFNCNAVENQTSLSHS